MVIQQPAFCFSAYKNYNIEKVAIDLIVAETFLFNKFLIVFSFLLTKVVM